MSVWSQPNFYGYRQVSLTTPRAIVPVDQGRMSRNSVVPNNNGVRLPSHSAVQILAVRQMIIQEFQEIVAFFLLEADNVSSKLRIDIQRLLASRRMRADKGMNLTNRSATDRRTKG